MSSWWTITREDGTGVYFIDRQDPGNNWFLDRARLDELADHHGAAEGFHEALLPKARQAGLRRRVQTKREHIRATAALKANAEW